MARCGLALAHSIAQSSACKSRDCSWNQVNGRIRNSTMNGGAIYRITPLGRDVAQAEATRLSQLVKLARACGFATGRA